MGNSKSHLIDHIRQISNMMSGTQKAYWDWKLKNAQLLTYVKTDEIREQYPKIDEYLKRNKVNIKQKECYRNAGKLCSEVDGVDYVEGEISYHGIPIEHAWNKIDGKYFDITKDILFPKNSDYAEYVKIIELDIKEYMHFVFKHEHWGGYILEKFLKDTKLEESLLVESPDKIIGPNGDFYAAKGLDSKNYSFEVILNKETEEIADVLISKVSNKYHGDDSITEGPLKGKANKTRVSFAKKGTYTFDWTKVYPGRLFTKPKVIAFWVYPSEYEMRTIISIMEKKMKIKMINTGWTIEVYDTGIQNKGKKTYSNNYYRYDKPKLIPIEQFVGSQKPPEKEYLQHLDDKHKNPVIPGFGSRNPDYMSKRKWQMATPGMESKKEEFFPRLFEENEKK